MNNIIIIALIVFASLGSSAESASSCGIPDMTSPNYNSELREEMVVYSQWYWTLGGFGWGNSRVLAYAMDQVDWNEGFGWENGYDPTYPLGRTINAIYVLEKSGLAENCGQNLTYPSSYCYPGSIYTAACASLAQATLTIQAQEKVLEWAGCYVRSVADELDAHCWSSTYGPSNSILGQAFSGTWVDDRIEIFKPGFYATDPGVRASALVHEARHMTACGEHNGTNGSQEDYSWQDGCSGSNAPGAYHFQTVFVRGLALRAQLNGLSYINQTPLPAYVNYTYLGYKIPVARAESLMMYANGTLNVGFSIDPGFRYRVTHIAKSCTAPNPWISSFCLYGDLFGQAYTCSGAGCDADEPLSAATIAPVGEYQPPGKLGNLYGIPF